MSMILLKPDDRCSFEGCRKKAVAIAVGRLTGHTEIDVYCQEHAEIVSDENNPEYPHTCPNCGLMSGIN